jgi:predicted amidohydrolase
VTRVATCQLELAVGQLGRNRDQARAAIERAAEAGAEVIVLPELTPSGYVFHDAAEARELAEAADGPTVQQWQQLSAGLATVIVGGFCERGPSGAVFNSAVIIDHGRLRAVYRKAHLWDRETLIFTPGSDRPPVVDTRAGRIATMVCYDLEFPEWVRLAALDGAQLLAAPTNWPLGPRPAGERPMEAVRVQAAASVNRIFIAAADRCGSERDTDWVGGSVIVDPDGFPLAGPVAADVATELYADLELELADSKQLSAHNDVLADRRLDLY